MSKQGRKWKLSHFQRLFLRTIIPIALAVCVVFLTLFAIAHIYEKDQQEIYRMEKQEKLEQVSGNVASKIGQIEYQQLRLLTDADVTRLVYLYDELRPYDYYKTAQAIAEGIARIVDDFQEVKDVQLYFCDIDVLLNKNGRGTRLMLPAQDLHEAGQKKVYVYGETLYIVRPLLRKDNLKEACYAIVQLDTGAFYESYSYICYEHESVLLSVEDTVLQDGGHDGAESMMADMECMIGEYGIRAVLKVGESRYALSHGLLYVTIYVSIALLVVFVVFFSYYAYAKLYRPLKLLLVEAFSFLEKGQLDYRIPILKEEPFISVYRTFNSSMEKLEYLMDNVYRQKVLISEMKLKQLQAQINPHFMYNTYYTLYRLIQDGEWEYSGQLAGLLGDFYRYITRTGNSEKRLKDEVGHTVTYVQIQAMRFPNMVQEIQTLPAEYENIVVPQLILQPVFENVFQHAQQNLQAGEALEVHMHYAAAGEEYVEIVVENNGVISDELIDELGKSLESVDSVTEITGLLNIHKRLKLFYGDEAGLRVSKSSLGGLRVAIRVMR